MVKYALKILGNEIKIKLYNYDDMIVHDETLPEVGTSSFPLVQARRVNFHYLYNEFELTDKSSRSKNCLDGFIMFLVRR